MTLDYLVDLKKDLVTQFQDQPVTYHIMIGKTDIYYPRMLSFRNYLDKKGYRYDMHVTAGGHQWYNWEEYANIFMQKIWK